MNEKSESQQQHLETFSYDDDVTKLFVTATLIWGAVAMFLGVLVAFQLADWRLNFGIEWLTFGRLRPLHTNAAIFAFAGNGFFAGIYHSMQRLLKCRMFNDTLGRIHFWGWQLIIVCAAITLPMGLSRSKEYAELEWPIGIMITIVWVVFAVNFFGTLFKRREKHIYVAIWFYIATIVTVAVLHIVNSLAIPVSWTKSYSIYAGVQDALVQWWYGHNAVAFFLTTPFLGLMYYFVPKAANRPIYSYRLSIIHFWSLVFLYIWAGPHHLLYSALPEWVQTLGVVFSISLWAPSWGGMINGLLTIRGVWHRLRTDHTLKFLATALTFYGMSTFEGPLLSIKSVNSLAHFTSWIVGHVHSGTIGWNYFMVAGIFYYLIPYLWKTKLYSQKLGHLHFWTATIGLLFYIVSMWVAGVTQGLMWRAIDQTTGMLVYPNFVETVIRIVPMYWIRAFGGVLVLTSFLIMMYNFYKTIQGAPKKVKPEEFQAPALHAQKHEATQGHRKLEGLPAIFSVLVVIAILVGSAIEILPGLLSNHFIEENPDIKPLTALEQAGRDIYTREGCFYCHSQMIRPMPHETMRYGKRSTAAEYVYDHPFQWGSRRTGPDLARIGGKYPNMWHYRHMIDPREMTPGSIMPVYDWLIYREIDFEILPEKLTALRKVGVPYSDEEIQNAVADAKEQAESVSYMLTETGVDASIQDKEIVALIAYLQRLGVDAGESTEFQFTEENLEAEE